MEILFLLIAIVFVFCVVWILESIGNSLLELARIRNELMYICHNLSDINHILAEGLGELRGWPNGKNKPKESDINPVNSEADQERWEDEGGGRPHC